ncbi:hypothetical protein EHP00_2011 [Ecytonucleospora hepatopenaei]|uniref:Uncharacterized protein n=1 Tax=Ecytonucleospora hepatopenaei TaxID=646526 RepID=A0A1W0E4B1_9MICR|nr:hypothetical protein EHP00_2011 [Ecytonucleospora hepatopenaei]
MALAAATIATSSPVLCNKSKSENIESCDCVTLLNGLFIQNISFICNNIDDYRFNCACIMFYIII